MIFTLITRLMQYLLDSFTFIKQLLSLFIFCGKLLWCCCCCYASWVVYDSVRPHRRKLTRLPCPWDSPGNPLEWVAISFSNVWKWKVKVKSLSRVRLFATSWIAAYQAPPSVGFFQARVLEWRGAIAFSGEVTLELCKYPVPHKSIL